MHFKAITQLALITVSLVIIFAVIRPLLGDIGSTQDEIAEYRNTLSAIGQYNTKLNELRSRANSFTPQEMRALETYLPSRIDILSVSRDIQQIAEQNQILIESIGVNEVLDTDDNFINPLILARLEEDGMQEEMQRGLLGEAREGKKMKQFVLKGFGTYEQIVSMLADAEQNVYPLRLVDFRIAAGSGAQTYGFEATFETYALALE